VSRFFHSVGTRLSLALVLVVGISLGIVYLAVVPSLQSRLENARLAQLNRAAGDLRRQVEREPEYALQGLADTESRDIGARVAVLPSTLTGPIADSSSSSAQFTNDPLAAKALANGRVESGTTVHGDKRYAEVAAPYVNGTGSYVLMLSDSLDSQLGSVRLVQKRVLQSAAAALLISLLLGYGGAWIRRRSESRAAASTSRSATAAGTSSAIWRSHSSGCASGWRSSTTRGASSWPTPPTSCERRSSRWRGSSS